MKITKTNVIHVITKFFLFQNCILKYKYINLEKTIFSSERKRVKNWIKSQNSYHYDLYIHIYYYSKTLIHFF